MEVNDKLVLQPPIDQSPMRDYYSDEELARGLPPVAEYRQQNLNRPGVLGFVDAGTTLRFDHVIRSQSVWDATLDYWGTITSGPHAGKRVILDNLNVWDSGDAPRNPDPNLIVPTRRTTQTRPNR